jgi:hypothetical protein
MISYYIEFSYSRKQSISGKYGSEEGLVRECLAGDDQLSAQGFEEGVHGVIVAGGMGASSYSS